MKHLFLLLTLMMHSILNAQVKYMTWSSSGQYLFSSKDTLELLKNIKSDTINGYLSYNLIPIYQYYTTEVSSKNANLVNTKLCFNNKTNDIISVKIKYTDSLDNIIPAYDSFPDGKWFQYNRQNNSILLREYKEIENKMKKKYFVYYDSLTVNKKYYLNGFPYGLEITLHKNKIIYYECKYKNIYCLKEYEKLYNPNGTIFYYKNYNTYVYTEYYPNGKIHKTSKIDKFGNLYGKM